MTTRFQKQLFQAASLALPSVASAVSAQQPAEVAFVDVNLVPLDADTVLDHMTVVVQGDRVATVGRASRRWPHFGKVVGVIARGKWLPQGELDRKLEELAAGYAKEDSLGASR